jgi:hypothetical protein
VNRHIRHNSPRQHVPTTRSVRESFSLGEGAFVLIRARWRTHLRNAESEASVLEVVRSFVREWRAEYVDGIAPTPAALNDFLLFATHASVRLGEVAAGSQRPESMR